MSIRPYLGINVNAASVEELYGRGLLEQGETLLALFDGVLLDQNQRRVGGLSLADFVALTDQRVITWARGIFNDTVDSFPWKDVDVVETETWDPWHGRVNLAFRIPGTAPRKRRVAVHGSFEEPGRGERLVVNTLDYMPADDVAVFARMIGLVGDMIVNAEGNEALITSFFAAFPSSEQLSLQTLLDMPSPTALATLPPVNAKHAGQKEERKSWWPFGRGNEDRRALTPPKQGSNLVAAYESQRLGIPAGSGTLAASAGSVFSSTDQLGMYAVSRTLRLFLEAPRRALGRIRRAGETVSGAGELVSGLQDPRVRRNAMRGLYQVAAQQEAEGGPLAPVGPVVRAVVRFTEPSPQEQSQSQQQSRRIQVRPNVGVKPRPTPMAGEAGSETSESRPMPSLVPAASSTSADTARPDPLKRSISVRRVEPLVTEGSPAAEGSQDQPQRSAPVRRIAVGRTSSQTDDSPSTGGTRAASEHSNGVHRSDDEKA